MKNLKVLEIRGFFRLPDDFKGTEDDAIQLLAAHFRSHPVLADRCEMPPSPTSIDRLATFREFLEACEAGRRTVPALQMWEFWSNLPRNLPEL